MPLLDPIAVAAPTSVADYTTRDLIAPHLVEQDAAGIIGKLSHSLQRQGTVADVLAFYQTALNQELFSSSALDCGIALPHARILGLKQMQFALGRAAKPVVWGAKGSPSIDLVFLLAVPATDAAAYLYLLASLARLGQQPATLASLRSADSADALFSVLQRVKLARA